MGPQPDHELDTRQDQLADHQRYFTRDAQHRLEFTQGTRHHIMLFVQRIAM